MAKDLKYRILARFLKNTCCDNRRRGQSGYTQVKNYPLNRWLLQRVGTLAP
jgi:hypothetical protein